MADIFSATNETRNKVPTSVFDWSHAVHTTTDLGRITPVFCELVPSKTSLRVNAKLGFQFMPMVFPLQSRIRYRLAFFKYPLRALWTDFRDFTGNFRQDLEEPYIDFAGSLPKTGSLWDYLGLPTTFSGSFGTSLNMRPYSNWTNQTVCAGVNKSVISETPVSDITNFTGTLTNFLNALGANNNTVLCCAPYTLDSTVTISQNSDVNISLRYKFGLAGPIPVRVLLFDSNGNALGIDTSSSPSISISSSGETVFTRQFKHVQSTNHDDLQVSYVVFLFNRSSVVGGSDKIAAPFTLFFTELYNGRYGSSSSVPLSDDLTTETSPYYDSTSNIKDKQLKIAAYAARAYEGVYNSWFRDNRNNPYYLDGQVEYNKWIPNYKGGADPASNYGLRYANWERDFLTTAVQTPQQGIAPLVGITTYEDTVTLEDGTVRTVNKVAITDEDGKSYKIGFDSDENGLKGVSYQPLGDMQVAKPTSLIQLAQSGISIADLRNVNAYQRYLELNIRAGYSYKDIIEHRFDVRIGYNELLMPEFIGGTSDWVEMHSVTQTVMKEDNGTYADALGSQAGIAGARKGTETINCFCDEESIILGVLVFTPVPIYTQLLPKHFLYRGLLDHFSPEFANIGFQPILMREVAPVQQWNADKTKMLDTFGYNRAWYEFCQKQDTAHGLYRTQLRNFIMNRVFNEAPSLNQSFLLVDPSQVNDVFAVTETTDKIYGQIYFDAKVKLPIPRVAIPRLE